MILLFGVAETIIWCLESRWSASLWSPWWGWSRSRSRSSWSPGRGAPSDVAVFSLSNLFHILWLLFGFVICSRKFIDNEQTFSLNLVTTFLSITTLRRGNIATFPGKRMFFIPNSYKNSMYQTHLVWREGSFPLCDILQHLLHLLVAHLYGCCLL